MAKFPFVVSTILAIFLRYHHLYLGVWPSFTTTLPTYPNLLLDLSKGSSLATRAHKRDIAFTSPSSANTLFRLTLPSLRILAILLPLLLLSSLHHRFSHLLWLLPLLLPLHHLRTIFLLPCLPIPLRLFPCRYFPLLMRQFPPRSRKLQLTSPQPRLQIHHHLRNLQLISTYPSPFGKVNGIVHFILFHTLFAMTSYPPPIGPSHSLLAPSQSPRPTWRL